MSAGAALIAFPVVLAGELPDKTMFASLLLATRGRPLQVWSGIAAAFAVHVVIAVTVGATVVAVLPHRAVDAVVAVMFLAGAVWAWRSRHAEGDGDAGPPVSGRRAVVSAFVVIFAAEWGDLTQVLVADLTAREGAPVAVGIGSLLALWVVAGVAVTGGRAVLQRISVRRVRQVTAVVLGALAVSSGVAAL